jgi:hypothetical protein
MFAIGLRPRKGAAIDFPARAAEPRTGQLLRRMWFTDNNFNKPCAKPDRHAKKPRR